MLFRSLTATYSRPPGSASSPRDVWWSRMRRLGSALRSRRECAASGSAAGSPACFRKRRSTRLPKSSLRCELPSRTVAGLSSSRAEGPSFVWVVCLIAVPAFSRSPIARIDRAGSRGHHSVPAIMTGRWSERGGVRTPRADIISGKLGNIADSDSGRCGRLSVGGAVRQTGRAGPPSRGVARDPVADRCADRRSRTGA